jgi:hypothetical protein
MRAGLTTQMPLRIPQSLHADLKAAADDQGVSLNQYCLYLLTKHVPLPATLMTQKAEELLKFIQEAHGLQSELEKSRPKSHSKILLTRQQTPLERKRELYGKI